MTIIPPYSEFKAPLQVCFMDFGWECFHFLSTGMEITDWVYFQYFGNNTSSG